jgi:hypothetical protein
MVTMFPRMRSPRPRSRDNNCRSCRRWEVSKGDVHDAVRGAPEAHDKLAEILVRRDQHALILMGPRQDLCVIRRWTDIGCPDDVEALLTQPLDDSAGDALVREQTHGHSAGNTDSWAR